MCSMYCILFEDVLFTQSLYGLVRAVGCHTGGSYIMPATAAAYIVLLDAPEFRKWYREKEEMCFIQSWRIGERTRKTVLILASCIGTLYAF